MAGQRRENRGDLPLPERVAILEDELARMKRQLGSNRAPWYERIAGTFADDPAHAAAMRLGRQYRQSLRPKRRKRP